MKIRKFIYMFNVWLVLLPNMSKVFIVSSIVIGLGLLGCVIKVTILA